MFQVVSPNSTFNTFSKLFNALDRMNPSQQHNLQNSCCLKLTWRN